MACPLVRGDNLGAIASGLSYGHVDKHGIIYCSKNHYIWCLLERSWVQMGTSKICVPKYQGPELQCLLRVKEDLSVDFSGCEK